MNKDIEIINYLDGSMFKNRELLLLDLKEFDKSIPDMDEEEFFDYLRGLGLDYCEECDMIVQNYYMNSTEDRMLCDTCYDNQELINE